MASLGTLIYWLGRFLNCFVSVRVVSLGCVGNIVSVVSLVLLLVFVGLIVVGRVGI